MASSQSNKRTTKSLTTFLSGATSGCISTIALQPLDVVKTRMQMSAAYNRSVHLQPALSLQPNSSVFDTFRGIVQQDRISGLWRGVAPSILRNTMGVGVYFLTLNTLTARLASEDGSLSTWTTLLSGASSRSVAVILLCPLSVIKTRMETVEYSQKYRGVFHAMRTMARQEGKAALFAGLTPAIIRDAPYSALYMLIYLRSKESLGKALGLKNNRSSIISGTSHSQHVSENTTNLTQPSQAEAIRNQHDQRLTMVVNFASGAFGGGLATLLTQPQDVVKTRMQLSPKSIDGSMSRYSSVGEATRRVFNEEGVYGFFRGSSPRFLKRMLGSAITWMIFEEANRFYSNLLGSDNKRQSNR